MHVFVMRNIKGRKKWGTNNDNTYATTKTTDTWKQNCTRGTTLERSIEKLPEGVFVGGGRGSGSYTNFTRAWNIALSVKHLTETHIITCTSIKQSNELNGDLKQKTSKPQTDYDGPGLRNWYSRVKINFICRHIVCKYCTFISIGGGSI